MNNTKAFKLLYYLCFILTIVSYLMLSQTVEFFGISTNLPINFLLGITNLILVIMFSILIIKKNLNNVTILFPLIYLIFFFLVIIISIIYNNRLIIPYIHFGYYLSFILFNYLLFNIYSLLSIIKREK